MAVLRYSRQSTDLGDIHSLAGKAFDRGAIGAEQGVGWDRRRRQELDMVSALY